MRRSHTCKNLGEHFRLRKVTYTGLETGINLLHQRKSNKAQSLEDSEKSVLR